MTPSSSRNDPMVFSSASSRTLKASMADLSNGELRICVDVTGGSLDSPPANHAAPSTSAETSAPIAAGTNNEDTHNGNDAARIRSRQDRRVALSRSSDLAFSDSVEGDV